MTQSASCCVIHSDALATVTSAHAEAGRQIAPHPKGDAVALAQQLVQDGSGFVELGRDFRGGSGATQHSQHGRHLVAERDPRLQTVGDQHQREPDTLRLGRNLAARRHPGQRQTGPDRLRDPREDLFGVP